MLVWHGTPGGLSQGATHDEAGRTLPHCAPDLIAEERFERAFRHDHVESDLEGGEHENGKQKSGEQRLPGRDAAKEIEEVSIRKTLNFAFSVSS